MGSIGSLLGGGGKNSFKAEKATLDETQYGGAIQNALAQTTGQMNANATGGADMTEFANALKEQAAGNGPSLAQRQLETATQQNAAQAAGALAGAKGINPALAARMIAQNQAAGNQVAAGQAATTRLSEQLNTQQMLAQALEAKRAQDIAQQQANTQTAGTFGGLQQGQNQNRIGNVSQANQTNASVAAQNAKTGGSMLGGLLGAAGTVFGGPLGGALGSAVGGALGGGNSGVAGGDFSAGPTDTAGGMSYMAEGGEVDTVDARAGGVIPGRARVEGDDPRNDTVDTVTSPGEIVLPRSVAQAPDAEEQAAEFVKAIKAKKKQPAGYARVLQATRELDQFLAEGGEVKKSLMQSIRDWVHSDSGSPDAAEAGKAASEAAVDTTTGMVRRTKDAVKARNKALEAALAAAAEG